MVGSFSVLTNAVARIHLGACAFVDICLSHELVHILLNRENGLSVHRKYELERPRTSSSYRYFCYAHRYMLCLYIVKFIYVEKLK